jgi:hypothetical protein
MYQVAAATYSELDGYRAKQAESFVTWQVCELGSASALLELTPLAIADENVIGFATMRTLLDETIGELRTVTSHSSAATWPRPPVAPSPPRQPALERDKRGAAP